MFPSIDHLANSNDVCVDKESLRNPGLDTKACPSPAETGCPSLPSGHQDIPYHPLSMGVRLGLLLWPAKDVHASWSALLHTTS